MLNKIKETIKRFSMLKKRDRVLLCVSGGGDSVCMLLVFCKIAKPMGLKLYIAHLNHLLRGKESDKDQAYVERLGERFKIPVITGSQDVKGFSKKKKISVEDAARRLRYRFFTETARGLGANVIATSHTRDDQTETVLMRLLRGSGLRGLRGVIPVSKIDGIRLIRPMIDISRKEINTYLRIEKINPRTDSSNKNMEFSRNRIRHKLIPFLEKEYNKRLKDSLSNLAELIEKDYQYLEEAQDRRFKSLSKGKASSAITFSLKQFKKEHISMQRALTRKAIEELKGTLWNIDYRHWEEIKSLINKRPNGSIVHLPGGVAAEKKSSCIRFFKPKEKKERPLLFSILNIPGKTAFGRKTIKATILKKVPSLRKNSANTEYFDLEKLLLPITVRNRQDGDKMIPLGMGSHKKVSDVLIDKKIPLKSRDKIPVLVSSDNKILWLGGIKISDVFKVSKKSKDILKLELLTR